MEREIRIVDQFVPPCRVHQFPYVPVDPRQYRIDSGIDTGIDAVGADGDERVAIGVQQPEPSIVPRLPPYAEPAGGVGMNAPIPAIGIPAGRYGSGVRTIHVR